MKQRRNLIKLLFDRKRIEFNSQRHNQTTFIFLGIVFTLTSLISYYSLIENGTNLLTLCFIGLTWITVLATFRVLMNRIRTISIKGDMVIFKSLRGKNEVSNIQSIRSVTTYHLFNTRLTFVHYRIDSRTKKIMCITHASSFISSPQNAFRKALEISERIKERANHKPGSVFQPESERLSFI